MLSYYVYWTVFFYGVFLLFFQIRVVFDIFKSSGKISPASGIEKRKDIYLGQFSGGEFFSYRWENPVKDVTTK